LCCQLSSLHLAAQSLLLAVHEGVDSARAAEQSG
jgi:hypothetical protein